MAGRGGDPRAFMDNKQPKVVSKPYQNLSIFEPIAMATSGNIAKAAASAGAPPILNQFPGPRPQNIGTQTKPKSEGFFKKADPTPMDTMTSSGLNQYDQLTKWGKLNQDSLAGKIRVRNDKYPDREAYVPPGYDSDMVPYAVKISAARIGLPQNMEGWKQYMNMGLGERASHLGTEVKSMGSELGTGFSRVVDDAKGIISNLPFAKLFAGFGSNTTGTNTQQNNQQNVSSSNTGVMQNQPFLYTDPTSLGGPTEKGTIYAEDRFAGPGYTVLEGGRKGISDYTGEGMSDEMRAYFMSLDPAGREAFLMQTGAEREEQMRGAKNYNFLGQYGAPSEVEDTGTEERYPFQTLNDLKDYLKANNLPLPPWAKSPLLSLI